MARFTLPRDIYYGRGTLEELKHLKGCKAMVVAGAGAMRREGHLDRALAFLAEAGFAVQLFENVEPDPSIETVMRGAAAMRAFEPDWIVALGGGSPIDAAKAMWIFYEHPELTFEGIITPNSLPPLRKKARFAAASTTSGSASEVTAFSVITDYQRGIKYPLADPELTPDVAIVDPELAFSMPPVLAAHTGMDALSHAVEAYVSTLHSPLTDPLALQAVTMVFDALLPAFEGDLEAREHMHYAQCLAGMAFSNALLGIVHSIAHKLGAAFDGKHIAHGCLNALVLPYAIEYNAPEAGPRYAKLARAAGVSGNTQSELIRGLCAKIDDYNQALNIPGSLEELGIDEREFLDKAPLLARRAVEDACTASNPRAVSPDEMEALLRRCYYGIPGR